jgi:hypothetical protein
MGLWNKVTCPPRLRATTQRCQKRHRSEPLQHPALDDLSHRIFADGSLVRCTIQSSNKILTDVKGRLTPFRVPELLTCGVFVAANNNRRPDIAEHEASRRGRRYAA